MLNQVYGGWSAITVSGVTPAFSTRSFISHKLAYTATNVSTSAIVRGEGSIDGSSYFSLGSGNTLITADGTYKLDYKEPLYDIRFRLVSSDGGSAQIAPKYMGANV